MMGASLPARVRREGLTNQIGGLDYETMSALEGFAYYLCLNAQRRGTSPAVEQEEQVRQGMREGRWVRWVHSVTPATPVTRATSAISQAYGGRFPHITRVLAREEQSTWRSTWQRPAAGGSNAHHRAPTLSNRDAGGQGKMLACHE
jgi:hypothetical protein